MEAKSRPFTVSNIKLLNGHAALTVTLPYQLQIFDASFRTTCYMHVCLYSLFVPVLHIHSALLLTFTAYDNAVYIISRNWLA